jgi:hypothetical protein
MTGEPGILCGQNILYMHILLETRQDFPCLDADIIPLDVKLLAPVRAGRVDKDLCFSLLTGSPQSKNFTNTFSEVFLMLLGMTEGANLAALMILSTASARRLFWSWTQYIVY